MQLEFRQILLDSTIPNQFNCFGSKVGILDFGTVSKSQRFDSEGSTSSLLCFFVRIFDFQGESGITNLKFYMINSDGLKDSEVRIYTSNEILPDLSWTEMQEIPTSASSASFIQNRNGSLQFTSFDHASQFIYLKISVGFSEDTGVIGGDNQEIFKFACQFQELSSGLLKIQLLPAKIQIKPNSLDVMLSSLPLYFDKRKESNIYKFLKIFETDQLADQIIKVKKQHWIDTVDYVEI